MEKSQFTMAAEISGLLPNAIQPANSMAVYVNGDMVAPDKAYVSAMDRGFTLGDGVFETMRVSGGHIFRLADHLARLRRSVETIALQLDLSDGDLEAALRNVISTNQLSEAVLRLTISRGVPAARGLLPGEHISPTIVIQPSPFVPPSPAKYRDGFTAITAKVRRNEHSPISYIKSCNYLDNVLARMEAGVATADEAIMLNTAGNVACGSSSNIFLIREERVITPSIASGILNGITRTTIIDLCHELSIEVREEIIDTRQLLTSSEAFLTNSVIGVMPLTKVDGIELGSGKARNLTGTLQEAYERAVIKTNG